MSSSSYWTIVGPRPVAWVVVRRTFRYRDTHRKPCEDKGRNWSDVCQKPKKVGGEKKKSSRRNQHANTLMLDFQAPKQWENKFLLCKATLLRAVCHVSPKKRTQWWIKSVPVRCLGGVASTSTPTRVFTPTCRLELRAGSSCSGPNTYSYLTTSLSLFDGGHMQMGLQACRSPVLILVPELPGGRAGV